MYLYSHYHSLQMPQQQSVKSYKMQTNNYFFSIWFLLFCLKGQDVNQVSTQDPDAHFMMRKATFFPLQDQNKKGE